LSSLARALPTLAAPPMYIRASVAAATTAPITKTSAMAGRPTAEAAAGKG